MREIALVIDERKPHGGSGARRFDDERQADALDRGAECRPGGQVAQRGRLDGGPWRRRNAVRIQRLLGQDLVERELTGTRAGAGVRDREQLQQPLDGAVLAVLPVERDVASRNPCSGDVLDERPVCGVDQVGVEATRLERTGDAMARAERDITLGRTASCENGDGRQPESDR
jgi:hypothetical protein